MSPRSNKRPREEKKRIPVLHNATEEAFQEAFQRYKVVHLPSVFQNGISTTSKSTSVVSWVDLHDIFTKLNEEDKKSWCIENGKANNGKETTAPADFLGPKTKDNENDFAYCSFLIQHEKNVKENFLSRAPLSTLPFDSKWDYGPSIWVFFGRNESSPKKDLQGRPEHTDSVSHDGTWHYQLSGTKTWYLRPTKKLLDHMESNGVHDFSESDHIQVDCEKGDVLVINTALWWHQTQIPCQSNPSVSYARDFFMEGSGKTMSPDGGMSNVDGLYASNDIEEGTVIFTEHDMPDCELHRSKNGANCEVVELEDGTNAIVSTRDIAIGEFFCVPESDSEVEEEEEELQEDEESFMQS
eukprot:scaffold543_cov119-Cylindrotheca_fusiformis.AAC.29